MTQSFAGWGRSPALLTIALFDDSLTDVGAKFLERKQL
jgi:hypothetical protein